MTLGVELIISLMNRSRPGLSGQQRQKPCCQQDCRHATSVRDAASAAEVAAYEHRLCAVQLREAEMSAAEDETTCEQCYLYGVLAALAGSTLQVVRLRTTRRAGRTRICSRLYSRPGPAPRVTAKCARTPRLSARTAHDDMCALTPNLTLSRFHASLTHG